MRTRESKKALGSGDEKTFIAISRGLLNCPTAPFHEKRVHDYIRKILGSAGVPFVTDSGGNLIARLRKGEGAGSVALIAHTDHPGIHISGRKGRRLTGIFLGGVDAKRLPGAPVHLFREHTEPDSGLPVKGKISRVRLVDGEKELEIDADEPDRIGPGDFGTFAFPGWIRKNGKVYSRAIDDLIGCALILNLLVRASKSRGNLDLYGIFSRAEEVGFVGAQHLIAERSIPGKTPVISVETSRARPFAEMGSGPVLRVGDKTALFSSELDFAVRKGAEDLEKRLKTFRWQRRLMAGGTCEATPFLLAGYRTFGIALPLGHYHNMTDTGRIGPEYIGFADLINGLHLAEAVVGALQKPGKAEESVRTGIRRNYVRWKSRLTGSGDGVRRTARGTKGRPKKPG